MNVESALTITNSSISNCYGNDGGGIYLSGDSSITASNLIISEWYAKTSGGGIYLQNYDTAKIFSSNFSKNIANSDGCDI